MHNNSKKRALTVEDELGTCELIRNVQGSNGIEALILTRSAGAAGHLWVEKFGIVLLGLCMASPDGIELARRVRSFRASTSRHQLS
jgi:DNA-binding response OmpR family regulator